MVNFKRSKRIESPSATQISKRVSKKWGCVQMNLIVSAIGQGLLWAL